MYDVLLALKISATGTALALTTTQGGAPGPSTVNVDRSDGATTVTVDVPGLTAADLQQLPTIIKEKLAELAAKDHAAEQAKEALEAAAQKAAEQASAGQLPEFSTSFAAGDPGGPCFHHWGDPDHRGTWGDWGKDKSDARFAADKYYGHHSWGFDRHFGGHGSDHGWGDHGWGHGGGFGYHG